MDQPEILEAANSFRNAKRELIAQEWLFENNRSQAAAMRVVAAQTRMEQAKAKLRELARKGVMPSEQEF